MVNKRKLRAKWKRNAEFNEEQARRAAATNAEANAEAKLNRAWGGGKTADRMGKKLRPVDRVAKRVIMRGPRRRRRP
jgi:TnpA family transposase